MSISVENLTKLYSEQKAIDAISFSINAGEIVGFLGPNGAGKSTTMKILSGYLPPTSGKAEVLGMDVTQNSLEIKRRIGYLPELNPLYTDMYITEFLQFNANIYGIKNSKPVIERVIETTGLTLERKKKIGQLSKGYKQRVGLAQALINDPDVLILDEPTSGLDPNQMGEIRKLILELGKNKTILLSSHIMQEVEAMCSKVIIINKGKIVANDSLQAVKNRLNKNATAIRVTFRETINTSKLSALAGVASVESLGGNTIKVTARTGVDLPELLFRFAVDNKTIILEQREETESLEAIFQQLTKNV
jgi:ABC-2 type transport system ATP-binding protein